MKVFFLNLCLACVTCVLFYASGRGDIVLQEFFWHWQLLRSALFQDDGDALTTTDAGRANSVLASSSPVVKTQWIIQSYLMCRHLAWYTVHIITKRTKSPELMNQVGSDTCSRSTERMSDGNSSTVDIGFCWIQSKSLSNSQVLSAKSLVHLYKANDISDTTV